MTPEKHLTEIHTEEEISNKDHKKEDNVNEMVLNIDELIQSQGSSSSKSCMTLEAKTETTDPILCTTNDAVTAEHNKSSCYVVKTMKGENFEEEDERVCRICQLSQEQAIGVTLEGSSGLIPLGCVCKDELGLAHTACAEAWFRLKGNRFCEICGETAMNVSGDWDEMFIEKIWNDSLLGGSHFGGSSQQRGGGGCWRGQTFCNFLIACLVIAFILPWFFRGKIF